MSASLKTTTHKEDDQLISESFLARDIFLHKDISNKLKINLACITNKITSSKEITTEGIGTFLKFHPLHVIRTSNNKAYCIANIRGYQLVKAFLEDDSLIPTLVHPKNKNMNVNEVASLDSLLSTLVYGLEKTGWRNDFFAIWDNVSNKTCKKIFPAMKNKTSLSQYIICSRLFLYKKELESPKSLLKKGNKKGA